MLSLSSVMSLKSSIITVIIAIKSEPWFVSCVHFNQSVYLTVMSFLKVNWYKTTTSLLRQSELEEGCRFYFSTVKISEKYSDMSTNPGFLAGCFACCPRMLNIHITGVLASPLWLPVQVRADFKVLLLTYESLRRLAPTHLSEPSDAGLQVIHPVNKNL